MSVFCTVVTANLYKVYLTGEIINSYRAMQEVIWCKQHTFSGPVIIPSR